jgi:hypothetical protein
MKAQIKEKLNQQKEFGGGLGRLQNKLHKIKQESH